MAYLEAHKADILVVIIGFMVLWQLLSGTAWGGRRQRDVTREGEPRAYWIRMIFQAVVLVVVFVMRNEWTSSSRSERASGTNGRNTVVKAVAESPFKARRRRAYDLHNANEFAAALPLYDSLLAEADTSVDLHYFRGVARRNVGQSEGALEDFRRVIARRDTDFAVNQDADLILSEQQRWEEILAMWSAFIAKNPTRGAAYYERGGAYYRKGDRTAALADAKKACELGDAMGCTQAAKMGGR